jgi:hypothetical protein
MTDLPNTPEDISSPWPGARAAVKPAERDFGAADLVDGAPAVLDQGAA